MPGEDTDHGVRQLVLVHGHREARIRVPPERKALVDIAAAVMADEAGGIGITYAGFALTALPHKRLTDDAAWEKTGHRVRLLIEPGRRGGGTGQATFIGVPYGAYARMILLYLQTQAVRTNSREVELGRSLRDWLGRMGITVGGKTTRTLREQAARIAACSLKFFWEGEDASGWTRGGIVASGLRFRAAEGEQDSLWEDRVVLDEAFWRALRDHPVPLREAAIRHFGTGACRSTCMSGWPTGCTRSLGQCPFPGRRCGRSSAPAMRRPIPFAVTSARRWHRPWRRTRMRAWSWKTAASSCTHRGPRSRRASWR